MYSVDISNYVYGKWEKQYKIMHMNWVLIYIYEYIHIYIHTLIGQHCISEQNKYIFVRVVFFFFNSIKLFKVTVLPGLLGILCPDNTNNCGEGILTLRPPPPFTEAQLCHCEDFRPPHGDNCYVLTKGFSRRTVAVPWLGKQLFLVRKAT